MCDSFVYVPQQGQFPVIFGKNSDREPNEAQQIVRYSGNVRKEHSVQTTFIRVEAPQEVNEVILSKPFQMWGAEMGVNEHGVAIGNEAVFTRMPILRQNVGLTGMDMVRLGLESGRTAEEALKIIIGLLESHGQNACGGYSDKNFYYHNSLLIADPYSAYKLETAGSFWAYKRVHGFCAISNGLTIEDDYDAIADGAIDFAISKHWISPSEAFGFRSAFSSYWMPKLAACDSRRSLSYSKGENHKDWSVSSAFDILRAHPTTDFDPSNGQTNAICMHASGLRCPHQTTGSMVAELRQDACSTVWLTGSSSPCLSLYKPFYLGTSVLDEHRFMLPSSQPDNSYWWRFEDFHRSALPVYQSLIGDVCKDQHRLESKWVELDEKYCSMDKKEREEFSRKCVEQSISALDDWESILENRPASKSFFKDLLYKRFWKRQSSKLRSI